MPLTTHARPMPEQKPIKKMSVVTANVPGVEPLTGVPSWLRSVSLLPPTIEKITTCESVSFVGGKVTFTWPTKAPIAPSSNTENVGTDEIWGIGDVQRSVAMGELKPVGPHVAVGLMDGVRPVPHVYVQEPPSVTVHAPTAEHWPMTAMLSKVALPAPR